MTQAESQVQQFIEGYKRSKGFGSITLVFKGGRLVFVKKEETYVTGDTNEEVREVQTSQSRN